MDIPYRFSILSVQAPTQNRWSSSPMLSGSFSHLTLLLPSEMFNKIPQGPGLEVHPGVPNFIGNVVLMIHRVWADRFRCTEANHLRPFGRRHQ